MENLVTYYWFEIDEGIQITATEEPDQTGGQVSPVPDGTETVPTVDPDFQAVSDFLLGNDNPDPVESSSPEPSISPTPTTSASPAAETSESEVLTSDVTERLDNLILQVGVIDIVLVLSLVLTIVRNFIRVPR